MGKEVEAAFRSSGLDHRPHELHPLQTHITTLSFGCPLTKSNGRPPAIPNQINNSLGFPGIFRGTLDVFARTITDEMAIAATAEEKGLHEEYIVPTMMEWEVFINEAVAVAKKAIEQGVARRILSEDEPRAQTERMIRYAREETEILMREGHIKPPPAV